jgi:Cu(I)/Ag(I) efflux system membrane protein CusA/SilA
LLIWIYRPVIKAVMRENRGDRRGAVVVLAVTVWPARQLGTEFMPSLNEGTLLYMPTTLPGISVTKAANCCRPRTGSSGRFPEVASVYRQGRPRRDRDRSGAVRDVRDGHQPEAQGEWRPA